MFYVVETLFLFMDITLFLRIANAPLPPEFLEKFGRQMALSSIKWGPRIREGC